MVGVLSITRLDTDFFYMAGIISHCYRCQDGRRGDAYILRQSNLIQFLLAHEVIARLQAVVFADSAYPNNTVMMTMYRGRVLPPWAHAFNNVMARPRTSVEWGYNQVCRKFAYVDWRKQLKIELMPVESIWHFGVFLTNCLTAHCGGNQISDFFECLPPTLEEYLQGVQVVLD